MVERFVRNEEVRSSNLLTSTKYTLTGELPFRLVVEEVR